MYVSSKLSIPLISRRCIIYLSSVVGKWLVIVRMSMCSLFMVLMYSDSISYQVRYLSSIQHRNLVTLLGYCQENDQQILVYEYIPNGSVSIHLYGNPLFTKTSVSSLPILYLFFTSILSQANFDCLGNCLIFSNSLIAVHCIDYLPSSQLLLPPLPPPPTPT